MAKQNITLEDLAQKIDGVKDELKQEIRSVKTELKQEIKNEIGDLAGMTKRGFDEMQKENKKHFEVIESAQADLKLRQDNVAYRFELNALDGRVTKLEKGR